MQFFEVIVSRLIELNNLENNSHCELLQNSLVRLFLLEGELQDVVLRVRDEWDSDDALSTGALGVDAAPLVDFREGALNIHRRDGEDSGRVHLDQGRGVALEPDLRSQWRVGDVLCRDLVQRRQSRSRLDVLRVRKLRSWLWFWLRLRFWFLLRFLLLLLLFLLRRALLVLAVSVPVVPLLARLWLRFRLLVRLDCDVDRGIGRFFVLFLLNPRWFLRLFPDPLFVLDFRHLISHFLGIRRLVSAGLAGFLLLRLASVELVIELVFRLPDDLRLLRLALVRPHLLVAVLVVVRLPWPVLVVGTAVRVSALERIKPPKHIY